VQSTLQNAKHEPPREIWGYATQKIFENACSEVLSEAQSWYAKDRLWKSAVREISLAVHANFVFLKLSI